MSRNAVFQGRSIQILHGDECMPMLVINFVDGADVGMIQSGSGFGFTAESLKSLRILGNGLRQEFQRYKAAKRGVLGLVDNAHPATTELLDDAVVRNGLADERLGLRHVASMLGRTVRQVNGSGSAG